MVDISQDDDMRKAVDLAKSIYTPSPDEQYTQANILPYRKYSSGRLEFDPTAGLMGAIGSAITAPGRAMKGEIPLHEINEEGEVVPSQKAIGEALNVAGNIMGGGIPASALERSGGMMLGTSGTRMVPETAAVQLAKRELSPVGLYSHGAEAAMALPQATGSVDQMIAMLRKQPGVTEAELRNAGLLTPEGQVNPEWLSRGKIGREDIASHLQSRMPQVEESILKASSLSPQEQQRLFDLEEVPFSQLNENEQKEMKRLRDIYDGEYKTKYESYTLPGGENYREVLLKLPQIKNKPVEIGKLPATELFERNMMEKYGGNDFRSIYQKLNGNEIDKYNMLIRDEINTSKNESLLQDRRNNFQSQHWDEPNVLAHIRMADRTGPNGEKILHVEEVQSDWGQKGKKDGFADPLQQQKLKEMVDRYYKLEMERKIIQDKINEYHTKNELSPKGLIERHFEITQERSNLIDQMDNIKSNARKNVPSAPYVTSTQGWTDLALKRILKEAAEGGYDKVVWTPGAEQAGRYDLSKQIGQITARPTPDGKIHLDALTPDMGTVVHNAVHAPNEIDDIVGKELADKIRSEIEFPKSFNDPGKSVELSGLDLKVGGEGMKEYYDKILPNRLQSVAKKHDKNAKVQYTDVMLPSGGGRGSNNPPIQAPGLDITPQMRESILRGQGAFKKGGAVMPHHSLEDIMKLARKHFDDGGDVRGGDNPGGLSGDTGAFSGGYSDRDLQSLYSSAMDSGSFLRDVAQQTERPEYYSDRGGGRSFTDAALDIANQVIGITPAEAGEKIYGTGGILPQVISGGQTYENQNELNRIRAEQDAARARNEAYSIAKAQADQAEKSASFPITGYEPPIGQTTGFGANVSGIMPTGQFTPSAEDLTQSLTTTAGLVGSGRGIAGPTSQDISNQQFFDRLNTNQMARAAIRDMATAPEEPARQSPFEAFSQAITSNRQFPDVTQTSPFDAYTRATTSPRQFPTSNLATDPEAADRAINAARAAATGSAAASVAPEAAPINQPARPITATPSTARAPAPAATAPAATAPAAPPTAVLPASKAAAPAPEEQAPVITTPSQVPPMPPIPYRDLGAGNLLDNVLKTFGLDTESWINNKSKQYEEQGMSPSNAAIQASYDLRDLQMNMNKREGGGGRDTSVGVAPAVAPVATAPVAPTAAITPNYTPYVYGQNIPYANYGAYGNFGANPFVYNTGINWAAVPGYRADGGKVVGNNALANSLRMAKAGNR